MGPKKRPQHDYGEYSFRLNQYQGLLKNKEYIRARMKDGSWQQLQIHSKHSQAWFNVLRPGEDVPEHSIQLCNGGRWYRISGPDEWIPDLEQSLEVSTADIALTHTTLPVMEEDDDLTMDDTLVTQTTSDKPKILPEVTEGITPTTQAQAPNNNEFPSFITPTGDQCQDTYLQLPSNPGHNLLLIAESISQIYNSLHGIKALRPPIGNLALNLGELILLRLQNPRPRRPLQDIDKHESAILQQMRHIYDKIKQENPQDQKLVQELGNEIEKIAVMYHQQKKQAIALAEPAQTTDHAQTTNPAEVSSTNPFHNIVIQPDPVLTAITNQPMQPTLNVDTNPFNSTEAFTPTPHTIPKPVQSTIPRKKGNIDNTDTPLIPGLPEPRRIIQPTMDDLYTFYSPEEEMNEFFSSRSRSSPEPLFFPCLPGNMANSQPVGPRQDPIPELGKMNFPLVPFAPNFSLTSRPPLKVQTPEPFNYDETPNNQTVDEEFRNEWDDVVANIILKSDQQKEQLAVALQKILQQEQELKQHTLHHQKTFPNLAIRNNETEHLPRQLLEYNQANPSDNITPHNNKVNQLITRERELLDTLDTKDTEIQRLKQGFGRIEANVSALKDNERRLQANITSQMNDVITNVRERVTLMNQQNEDLNRQLNKEQTMRHKSENEYRHQADSAKRREASMDKQTKDLLLQLTRERTL